MFRKVDKIMENIDRYIEPHIGLFLQIMIPNTAQISNVMLRLITRSRSVEHDKTLRWSSTGVLREAFRAKEIGAKGQQSNQSNDLGHLRSATH